MSIASIYGTQLPLAGGPAATRHAHPTGLSGVPASVQPPSTGLSRRPAADTAQWTAAIGAAMAQLGLAGAALPVPAGKPGASPEAGDVSPANRRGARQLQQYRNIASTSSRLVQALGAGASGTSPAGGLSTALQGMWTSLGAASGSAVPGTSGNPAMPHLPTFLQSLASHVGESGVSGLRGVFVDAVA